VIPEPAEEPEANMTTNYAEALTEPSPDVGNAPTVETEDPRNLDEIREELRRRNED
jgi:hypothetical protein